MAQNIPPSKAHGGLLSFCATELFPSFLPLVCGERNIIQVT